jgi:hypothetical protein
MPFEFNLFEKISIFLRLFLLRIMCGAEKTLMTSSSVNVKVNPSQPVLCCKENCTTHLDEMGRKYQPDATVWSWSLLLCDLLNG